MKKWMHKIEVLVDKIIPYMLVLLLAIIVIDLGFHEIAEHYHTYIFIADYLVIGVFVADLVFKWIRIRKIPLFLKKCWLDIIAVFPFFLVFRAVESIAGLFSKTFSEGFSIVQSILHEGVEIEKEGAKILEGVEKEGSKVAKEAGKFGKVSRTNKFARFLRPIFRAPRFVKALPFFESPTPSTHTAVTSFLLPELTENNSVSIVARFWLFIEL